MNQTNETPTPDSADDVDNGAGWSDIAPVPDRSRSWPKLLLVMALVGFGLRYLVLIGSST